MIIAIFGDSETKAPSKMVHSYRRVMLISLGYYKITWFKGSELR